MWAAGHTLDNLSLMALTISVGFVVDDAIVMPENITRYIEEGEEPLAAALKGSGQIGFDHPFDQRFPDRGADPSAADGGHNRSAVPRIRGDALSLTIVVSAAVSLTLTPMMAARFLPAAKDTHHTSLRVQRTRLRCAAERL